LEIKRESCEVDLKLNFCERFDAYLLVIDGKKETGSEWKWGEYPLNPTLLQRLRW
jgi:hypothetical protein